MIAALGRVAPEHRYLVSVPSGLGYEEVVTGIPQHELSTFAGRANLWKRWLYEQGELKNLLRRFNPDIILALANKGMAGFDCPQAILCHNPYVWHSRGQYGPYPSIEMALVCLKVQIQRFFLRRDLNKPHSILLHQTFTARDRIRTRFRYSGPAIHCPNAVSDFSVRSGGGSAVAVPDAVRPYSDRFKMFYVTRYYPHKNIEAIVETFRRHGSELPDTVVFITIAADQHPRARQILRAIEKHGLTDHVVSVGPLPQEELGGWFSACNALLMPTFLESFSGTYLEAMHFGLPILTSDLDFAHEVCQDAARYFDPRDPASIRDAILSLKTDPAATSDLVERGKKRLQEMSRSWDDITREVLYHIVAIAETE